MKSPTSSKSSIHGFESQTKEFAVDNLCVDDILIEKQGSTYITLMQGDDLEEAGIYQDDLIVLDAELNPLDGDIVCVNLNGQLKCRILALQPKSLISCSNSHRSVEFIEEFDDLLILGVVTRTVRCFRKLNTTIFD